MAGINQFMAQINQFFGWSHINTLNWLYLPIYILRVSVLNLVCYVKCYAVKKGKIAILQSFFFQQISAYNQSWGTFLVV
jgi:hypothetical protein